MDRLDRYIFRAAIGSYAAALLFVVFLFMVMDLLVDANRYVAVAREQQLGLAGVLGLWVEFHASALPWLFVRVAPFVTVISCMFATSRFMVSNEIAAMLFCGRSTVRVLRPVLLTGLLSALGMVATWEGLVPGARDRMERLGAVLGKETGGGEDGNISLRLPQNPRLRLLASGYDPDRELLTGLVLWDMGSRPEDMSEVRARSGQWDPERADWDLVDGYYYCGPEMERRDFLGMPGLTPDILRLLLKEAKESSLLSYGELLDLRAFRPTWHVYRLAFHSHISAPLANLVLLLLALPFAVTFERRTKKIGRVLLALLICAAYLAVDLTCQNLGRREYLHPVVAAWSPNILFGSLGLVIFGGIRS